MAMDDDNDEHALIEAGIQLSLLSSLSIIFFPLPILSSYDHYYAGYRRFETAS